MPKGAGMEAVARSAASQRRQTRTTSVQPVTNAGYCMLYTAPTNNNCNKM
ncbi:MAG: hypothetical protein LH615_14085 [Ferruginibacter sp.]|nr:hypothetical protein [Ferruginibacter sp.]